MLLKIADKARSFNSNLWECRQIRNLKFHCRQSGLRSVAQREIAEDPRQNRERQLPGGHAENQPRQSNFSHFARLEEFNHSQNVCTQRNFCEQCKH